MTTGVTLMVMGGKPFATGVKFMTTVATCNRHSHAVLAHP